MVALALDEQLLAALDGSRGTTGQDRSTFIRLALIDYLRAQGVDVPRSLAFPPDRTKGRRVGTVTRSGRVHGLPENIGKVPGPHSVGPGEPKGYPEVTDPGFSLNDVPGPIPPSPPPKPPKRRPKK